MRLGTMTSGAAPSLAGDTSRAYEGGMFRQPLLRRRLVATRRGRHPHTDDGIEVRRVFHQLRSHAIESFNGQFKGIFDAHGSVPTRGLIRTQRFALGAVFIYQLAVLYRFEHGQVLRVGLKTFLKAA
jgi:hypothetical protein